MALVIALATVVAPAFVAPAHAVGGEVLTCRINGTGTSSFRANCATSVNRSGYGVTFRVEGGSGTYTHSWSWSEGTAIAGCYPTSDFCTIQIDWYPYATLTAYDTITQGSYSTTVSTTAYLPAWCSNPSLC